MGFVVDACPTMTGKNVLFLQEVSKSSHVQRKIAQRQATRTLDPLLDEQVASGRFLACVSSRPGQVSLAPDLQCL